MNGTRICSIEGCDRPHVAKGLCHTHYGQVIRRHASRRPMTADELTRFRSKYRPSPSGCWEWTAGVNRAGYGLFHFAGETLAHRASYVHHSGPVPEGLELDHLCRNRRCVNPAHLEAVTRRVNILRSEGITAVAYRATHCPHGHEYTSGNTIITRKGHRKCRECKRATDRQTAPCPECGNALNICSLRRHRRDVHNV